MNAELLNGLDRRARDNAMAQARILKNQASYGCAQWVTDAVKVARSCNRTLVRRMRGARTLIYC